MLKRFPSFCQAVWWYIYFSPFILFKRVFPNQMKKNLRKKQKRRVMRFFYFRCFLDFIIFLLKFYFIIAFFLKVKKLFLKNIMQYY